MCQDRAAYGSGSCHIRVRIFTHMFCDGKTVTAKEV